MYDSIIDTHVHFWDPKHLDYNWLGSVSALNHSFLPEDYVQATLEINIEKIIFIECNCNPSQTNWK